MHKYMHKNNPKTKFQEGPGLPNCMIDVGRKHAIAGKKVLNKLARQTRI